MANSDVIDASFPVPTGSAVAAVDGIPTEVVARLFKDKVLITLSQEGLLAQWIQVPIRATPATMAGLTVAYPRFDMLPGAHITPKTLLGGGGPERQTTGHLLASQIANYISMKSPEDERTLVLGLGLKTAAPSQSSMLDVLELVQKVI